MGMSPVNLRLPPLFRSDFVLRGTPDDLNNSNLLVVIKKGTKRVKNKKTERTMKKLLSGVFVLCCFVINNAWASSPKFSVYVDVRDTFSFKMSAAGTFTVDCGDGGTLSGDGVSGNTITRNDTTVATYTCTYTNGYRGLIGFDGTATEYNYSGNANNPDRSPISFDNNRDIMEVSGDMSAVFPIQDGVAPQFVYTFRNNMRLSEIPSTLFASYNDTSIVDTSYMFYGTFYGCRGLESIPSGLFSLDMPNLRTASNMFSYTFAQCTLLQSIPSGLFSLDTPNLTNAGSMFSYTFYSCNSLQSIPSGLFSGINTTEASGVSGMFQQTFYATTKLSDYIPSDAFPASNVNPLLTTTAGAWSRTFYGTKLATECPGDTVPYTTGYESLWAANAGIAAVACQVKTAQPGYEIASTSYVAGMFEGINTNKQDNLSAANVNVVGNPNGFISSVTANDGVLTVTKSEVTVPVQNSTTRMSIWLE